ncbi:MAG: winged helix-turn-helix transcriptional regulator [Candidatus Thorarchaeota archaeon]
MEIAREKRFSRSLVSKYILSLLLKKKIFSRKIHLTNKISKKIYFSSKTGRNPEFEILEYIIEKSRGVTITEIAKKRGFSRNTVAKYVSILELKKIIKSKKIGPYRIYFSTEMKFFSKMFTISYYKAILAGLQEYFPNSSEIFKEIGRNSLKYLNDYLAPGISTKLKGMNPTRILSLYYDAFGKFYPSLNMIRPSIKLSTRKEDGTLKFILKLTNSEFLDNPDKYLYHYYISAGLIEAIWKREINKDVVCNVETVHISDDEQNSYVELSIK